MVKLLVFNNQALARAANIAILDSCPVSGSGKEIEGGEVTRAYLEVEHPSNGKWALLVDTECPCYSGLAEAQKAALIERTSEWNEREVPLG